MARISRRGGAAILRRSGRKMSVWLGVTSITPTVLASNTVAVFEIASNASLRLAALQGHIARTRGRILCTAQSGTTDPVAVWGIGVFDDGLTVATAFPSPASEPRDPYHAWGGIFGLLTNADATAQANIMEIDSKGKRRYDSSSRVVLVVENLASGHSIEVYFDIEILVIPDQGR